MASKEDQISERDFKRFVRLRFNPDKHDKRVSRTFDTSPKVLATRAKQVIDTEVGNEVRESKQVKKLREGSAKNIDRVVAKRKRRKKKRSSGKGGFK